MQRTLGNGATRSALQRYLSQYASPPGHFGTIQRQFDPSALFPRDELEFTDRTFGHGSNVCPSCHRQPGRMPLEFMDRRATAPRLVRWALEQGRRRLLSDSSLIALQLEPGSEGKLVARVSESLTASILGSHEFRGSQRARTEGVWVLAEHWNRIGPPLQEELTAWFRQEYIGAVDRTLGGSTLVTRPEEYRRVRTQPFGHTIDLGRWGATARRGQRVGPMVLDDVLSPFVVWYHLHDRPVWIYSISAMGFHGKDPFVWEVSRQVYERSRFAAQMLPLILQVAGFTLGLSARLSFVIGGIVLDEFGEEMSRDVAGKKRRSLAEMAKSGVQKLLIDRVFNRVFSGGGRSGSLAGEAVEKQTARQIDAVAERAAPVVRKEIAETEAPHVARALREKGGREVTDPALRSEGYIREVEVVVGGQRHIYRQTRSGTWCRFSKKICKLKLGDEVAEAALTGTERSLREVRGHLSATKEDIDFLSRMYARMRSAGRFDLRLLDGDELKTLRRLAGEADVKLGDLTLVRLRELPRTLDLGREYGQLASRELRLIEQLRHESIPLYDKMRAAATTEPLRRQILRRSRGLDEASRASPRSPGLVVDHVVPVREIIDMPGFSKLRFDDQLAIVRDVKNLRAVATAANSSRGSRPWSLWPQARRFYDQATINRMTALEDQLRDYLRARITRLALRR